MKIYRPKQDSNLTQLQINQLNEIIRRLENVDTRPCDGCTRPCACSQSTTCRCECSNSCPFAAKQLTSEDRYPIEPEVLPLVFAMSDMQICQPCWSCEGHESNQTNFSAQKQLSKVPQVWFYTNSVILVRLLDECLGKLKAQKWLNYDWQVCATFSERSCADCAFAVKPDLNLVVNPDLSSLQADLRTIAEKLRSLLLVQSKSYLSYLEKSLLSLNSQ